MGGRPKLQRFACRTVAFHRPSCDLLLHQNPAHHSHHLLVRFLPPSTSNPFALIFSNPSSSPSPKSLTIVRTHVPSKPMGFFSPNSFAGAGAAATAAMFTPEPHVAQQSRREKLRVPPSSPGLQQLYDPSPLPLFDFAGDWNVCSEEPYGDLHFSSLAYSPCALHQMVTSSSFDSAEGGPEMGPQLLYGANEQLLLRRYGGGSSAILTAASRCSENWNRGGGELAVVAGETQGLSLTLSSNPPPEPDAAHLQGMPASSSAPAAGVGRNAAGPLGPFTGYAAVLKSSKFLKPAQQLLDEFCSVVTKNFDMAGRTLAHSHCDIDWVHVGDRNGSSHSSPEVAGGGSTGGRAGEICRPEFEKQKTKLLYMQEEVCSRYKQYHQQMQMVVSSFESVAGLSSVTPYTSLALKAVSKHFRCLKTVISDQLRHVCNVLGDKLMPSSPSSNKSDNSTLQKLKHFDPSFRRQKTGRASSLSFSDSSHPVWRPQRGLPESAVSVLRAWLFDHFLHPYPTDTDKHMLATQTGLSRNQVSNWFINARVRLWKPMIEEMHMLETSGRIAGVDLNSTRHDDKLASAAELRCPVTSGKAANGESSHWMEQWHQKKRSRMEDGNIVGEGLMSIGCHGGIHLGGLGAVSLTLGLRQGEGGSQQEQQMRHFQQQILHDFVG
ncbi:BEL1-like homeodomain protein 8 [Apostasia shenzhenica]|uniref:BEL1-like homeodomain protein 8 n=1 Tax=Apostasia shenzhenica TaxID=1088818 RepID=A0A2H9ZYR2_9ASPA|nr:BEL1-like homeodomain protein 8 [Apostasia shenzhenica]